MASRSSILSRVSPRGPLEATRIGRAGRPLFDGTGAALHGARWNRKGQYVIYGSTSFAGALLEILVHSNLGRVPRGFAYIQIHIPADVAVEEISPEDLPGWNTADAEISRAWGSQWYEEQRSAVLLVPSVPSGGVERNVLIHQRHPDFHRITASEPVAVLWDKRIFGSSRGHK
jgi:RES domain-containing protein